MMKTSKQSIELIKNTGLFFIANFLPKAITFFMVPLYTYCLTTDEYGTVDLINTTVQLLLPILTLQVQDAMLRFTIEKKYNPNNVLTVGVRIGLAGTIMLIICSVICKLTGVIKLDTQYLIMFNMLYFANALRNILSYYCKGLEKIKILTVSNVMVTVITVTFNLILLLGLKLGVIGYLFSSLMGNVVAIILMFFVAKLYRYIRINISEKTLTNEILHYSIPLIWSGLAWWINTSLDKYILGYFYGTTAVGLMAVSYKIPSILSLIGGTIANAYSISAIKEFDLDDKDGFLGKSYATINMCFVCICSFLMIINIFIFKMLFSERYFEAWHYVPPLLFSSLMCHMSIICEQYFIALKKTRVISATAIIAAAINFCANMLLIPPYGVYGAAIATAFSFFSVWLIRYIVLTKKVKLQLKHSITIECIMYLLLLTQLIIANWGNKYLTYQILIFIVIITICALIYTRSYIKRGITK